MRNIGKIDKVLRLLIGIVGISLVFFYPQKLWGWLGIIPLFTGLINFCPLYKIIGLSTSSEK